MIPLPEEVLAALREVVLDGEGLVLGAGLCHCAGLAHADLQSQRCRGACSCTAAQQLGWGNEHAPTCAQIDDLTFVMSQEEIDQVQNAILTN